MANETIIRTLRHAQSTYGPEQRYAGSVDVPLSEKGERDCREAAEALAGLNVDVVVTSNLKRAIDTARLVGYEPSRCVRSGLCNERRYGVLEGRTWQEVQNLDPPVLFIEVGDDRHSVNPQGGEPFEAVWERARRFRRYLFREYEGLSILVVSHGVFLQMFHGVLRRSNCIESLLRYPATLELATLRFLDRRLVDETVVRLLDVAGPGF
jgi:2,3-bisphosphoglycerate-dependent phosphoglycerate mutase